MNKILFPGIFWPSVSAVVLLLSLGTVRADLSSEAQEAVQQGLNAIQKQDYPLAEHCFQDARKKGGTEVYYNIGLAESKIPGRELRAICWLGAYLAANPQTANASEVKATIGTLDAKSRDKTLHLIQALQDANRQMPEGEDRNYGLRDMVGRWAAFGDFVAAQQAVDFITDPNTKSGALENLANAYVQLIHAQVEAGDMTGAHHSLEEVQKAVALIPNVNTKSPAQYEVASAWIGIARGQLKTGDLNGVRTSLATAHDLDESIESPGSRYNVWENIVAVQVAMARAQLKAGDAAGARESLASALKTVQLLQGDPYNGSLGALQDIAETQIKAGDLAGARESLIAALPAAHDANGLRNIGQEQVRAGDLAGAKKTAELIQNDARWKFVVEIDIASAEIKTGDLTGARGTLVTALKAAELIPDTDTKFGALHDIAIARVKARDKEGAQKTAGLIQDASLRAATLSEISAPPKMNEPDSPSGPSPLMNPLPSDEMTMASSVTDEAWTWMLRDGLDEPCFTAFPDYSDIKAVAVEIQKIPVREGPAMRPGPLDSMQSLALVTNRMIGAQGGVDRMLKIQFKQ